MTTHSRSVFSDGTTATLTRVINRSLEALWLLAAFLIPLAFLDQNYAISEAAIGYVEVPKVALLRTLAGLIAMLWLIEWGLNTQRVRPALGLNPIFGLPRIRAWLGERPTRWVLLAAWFFLGTTLLSTVLSGSRGVSLWGEIPGQDGYPAYTIAAYVALFAVIATHLKTRAQLWRLMGAIVTGGTLVTGYAIFQHYGHDFFDLIEETGGGASEVSVFMGNSLFAGAAMMMVIPMTLVAAVLSVGEQQWAQRWSWARLNPFLVSLVMPGLWSAILAIQLLGITFTFARGPWVGTVAALVAFLGLAALFAGWGVLARAAVILALTVTFGVAMLHGLGSISILSLDPWFSLVIVLAGFLALGLVHLARAVFSRAVLGVGLGVALAVVIILAFSWYSGGGLTSGPQSGAGESTSSEVAERLSSIKGDVLGGFSAGRATHWRVSGRLFRDHPWPEFASLSLPWLRHLIGYGPELFRYTYLLGSPPEGPDLLPQEPDHAHNFFVHHAVEQGVFGLVSSLGLFVSAIVVGAYLLLRKARGYSLAHKLILIGLLATLGGRFLEMMVGVARVSDLTLLWVVLALFVALPQVMGETQAVPESDPLPDTRRRRRRAADVSLQPRLINWRLISRLAVVAWLIGGIFVLTWVKSVNNVRAAVSAGDAVKYLKKGDFQAGLAGLDRAIDLAPDIPVYYNYKSLVYSSYQRRTDIPPERECGTAQNQGYLECLAFRSYLANLEGKEKRPFYYRSHLAVADSAHTLGTAGTTITTPGTSSGNENTIVLADEAVRLYRETLALVPGSPVVRNALAASLIVAGQPEVALRVLEESLAITGGNVNSAFAYLVQARAYQTLGETDRALESLSRYIQIDPSGGTSALYTRVLLDILPSLGRSQLAADVLRRLGIAYSDGRLWDESAGFFEQSVLLYLALEREDKASNVLDEYLRHIVSDNSRDRYTMFLLEILPGLGRSQLSADMLNKLGIAFNGSQQWDKAAGYFERSAFLYLDLGQSNLAIEQLNLLGQAFRQQDRFEQLTEALSLNPDSNDEEGTLEHLAQELERNLKLDGDEVEAQKTHSILARIYTSFGLTELAATHQAQSQP